MPTTDTIDVAALQRLRAAVHADFTLARQAPTATAQALAPRRHATPAATRPCGTGRRFTNQCHGWRTLRAALAVLRRGS